MKHLIIANAICLCYASVAFAANISVIAAPNQPPYVFEDKSGLDKDICDALNEVQTTHKFVLDVVPSARGREQINSGTSNVMAMVNIEWGYDKASVKKTIDLLSVEDKFFALAENAKTQAFFDGVGKEETLVVNGFNYKFLNQEKDQKILAEKFNTKTAASEPAVISMIARGRGKIGVSSSTTLAYFIKTQPEDGKKLVISDKSDNQYFRHFIVHKSSPISVDELNTLLGKLKASGKLQAIYDKYNLKVVP